MTSTFVRRAKAVRMFGIGLAITGLIPVSLVVSRALVPAAQVIPELPATWLPAQKIAWLPLSAPEILFALIGLAVMWLGATIASRQRAIFEAEKRATEDRMRRVQQYSIDGRIEPYIGPSFHISDDHEPR